MSPCWRARPGFESRTFSIRCENHTHRPTNHTGGAMLFNINSIIQKKNEIVRKIPIDQRTTLTKQCYLI